MRRKRPTRSKWTKDKPKLPMQVSAECRVHYRDLEAYLAKVYSMTGYDVLRAAGATHGMCPEYIVTGDLPPARNIHQQMDAIRRGRRTRNLCLVLNVLCLDGYIPKGKYVIDTRKLEAPIIVYTQLLNETHDPLHPKCVAFKKRHHGDKRFMQRARTLDQMTPSLKAAPD